MCRAICVVLIHFLFFNKSIHSRYSSEVPFRGASNEYPQHMYSSRNKKNNFLVAFYMLLHNWKKGLYNFLGKQSQICFEDWNPYKLNSVF